MVDPMIYLEKFRLINKANYVDSSLSSVVTSNLDTFSLGLRSLLYAKFPEQATRANDKVSQKITCGPYPFDKYDKAFKWADLLEIKVTPSIELKRTLVFETIKDMTVSEFSQRFFIFSYLLTFRVGTKKKSKKWEMLATLSKNWINDAHTTVKEACGYDDVKKEFLKRDNAVNEKKKNEKENKKKFKKNDKIDSKNDEEQNAQSPVEIYIDQESNIFVEENVSLHQKRHAHILQWISTLYGENDTFKLLDFGCAQGILTLKVAEKFKKSKITAMDGVAYQTNKLRKLRNVKILINNLLYPNDINSLRSDIVVFTEVIEHFHFPQRKQLMLMLAQSIRPTHIVITTPNILYNKHIPLEENQFRHTDHKIEYSPEEFKKEVLDVLERSGYSIELHDLLPGSELPQPSFIVTAKLTDPNKVSPEQQKQKENELANLYQDVFMPKCKVLLQKKKILCGFHHHSFIESGSNVFYISPTISPVEFSPKNEGFLEHPQSAFEYYKFKGISRLVCEKKYMGSRVNIQIINTEKSPPHFTPIQMISKTGRSFFNEKNPLLEKFQTELTESMKKLGYDFMIIDCELMPWKQKAGSLIYDSFLTPGETAEVHRKVVYGEESSEYLNAVAFNKSLSHYMEDQPVHIRVFNILAAGVFDKQKKMEVKFLGETSSAKRRYEIINSFCSHVVTKNFVLPVEHYFVDLDDEKQIENVVQTWENYCDDGGEGFVVKCDPFIQFSETGQMIVPMLKVRGREYLRLIYGIDYLEKSYFEKLKNRSVRKKRTCSLRQHELASYVLDSHLINESQLKLRMLAAFFSVDSFNINATL